MVATIYTIKNDLTNIGNMHKNLANIARVVPEIVDRQADRHTYHNT